MLAIQPHTEHSETGKSFASETKKNWMYFGYSKKQYNRNNDKLKLLLPLLKKVNDCEKFDLYKIWENINITTLFNGFFARNHEGLTFENICPVEKIRSSAVWLGFVDKLKESDFRKKTLACKVDYFEQIKHK